MRDHSSRKYNKTKVTRYRTKSRYRADGPQEFQRFQYSQPLPRQKG
ncbi:MAG: hypothetical protein WCW26_00220 [Candidatus Buchananbacteria bacterium]